MPRAGALCLSEGVQSAEPDGVPVHHVEHAQRCRLATVLRPGAVKTTKAGSCALEEGQVDQTGFVYLYFSLSYFAL